MERKASLLYIMCKLLKDGEPIFRENSRERERERQREREKVNYKDPFLMYLYVNDITCVI